MWFRAKSNPSNNRTNSPPNRRRQQAADRKRESRRLLLESLEERRVLTFLPAVDYGVGDNPQALVSGDFNGDTRPDLVVANTGSSDVTLMLGNADGTFSSAGDFAVGYSPTSVAAGDFNGDGKLDLVTANSGDLSVLLGNGTGGFAAATSVPLGGARSVAVGDFNADGKLDLAVSARISDYIPPWTGGYYGGGGGGYFMDSTSVNVLLGSGNGGFGSPNTYPTGVTYRYPWEADRAHPMAVADLNGDGNEDIVAFGDYYYLRILLGNDNGTMQLTGATGISGSTIAIADLDGDENLDLATTNGSSISVALGDGQGVFGTATQIQAGVNPSSVTAADVNADGRFDLVVVSGYNSEVNVLLGQPGPGLQFTPPIAAGTGVSWVAFLSQDYNGDGRPDLATVDPGADAVSILLNDASWTDASAPSLQISNSTVTEGHTGNVTASFTVTLSAPHSQDVTFHYATGDYPSNSATAGVDYVAQSGEITIPAGQTSAVIEVPVIGDRVGESIEYFVVYLSNPTSAFVADGQGVGTILDDEPVVTMVDTYVSTVEGNTGTTPMNFVVRLSAASDEEVRVNYSTVEGDTGWWTGGGYYGGSYYYAPASADSDFQSAAGTLTFAPGEIEKTISILAIGDREGGEGSEYFFMNLSNPSGASLTYPSGMGIIHDDEPNAFFQQSTKVIEGTGSTTLAELIVTLSAPSDAPITVDYATRDWSTAEADVDYESTSGTVTFAPGETTQSIFIPVYGDSLAEYTEYIPVELTGATGAQASSQAYVEIVDDDAQISISDVSLAEGNSGITNFTFTVTMSSAATDTVTVTYETTEWGPAEPGSDFAAKSGTLVFAPGETSKTITISVYGDTRLEEDENFYVYLNLVSGNAIMADWEATGTILNDDTSSAPTIDISDAEIVEGNSGSRTMTFTVTLSHASNQEVRVSYGTQNGTARTSDSDYVSKTGTLRFSPGQTSKTITVKVKGDKKVESDETFFVHLSGAKNGVLGDGEGVGTILNDDGLGSRSSKATATYAAAVDAALHEMFVGRGKSRLK
jgi:urease beta subunit